MYNYIFEIQTLNFYKLFSWKQTLVKKVKLLIICIPVVTFSGNLGH